MTRDVIALLPRPPDVPAVLAAMAGAGEDLLVLPVADGAVLQLCDQPDGATVRALLTVEEPVLVPVPGEVARLLGEEAASQVATPLWWLEVRAAAEPDGAVVLARRFAEALAQRLGGAVWPAGAPAP